MSDPIQSPEQSQSLAEFSQRLITTVVLLNLLVYGLAGLSLYQSREKYEKQAAVSTQNLANVLDRYIEGEIHSIDIAINAVKHETEAQLARGKINKAALNAYISQLHGNLPELQGLRLTSVNGDLDYGTGGLIPGVVISVADRDYFIYQRDNPAGDIFISKPLLGRVAKKWILNVSRRVNNPDGSFAGAVYGSLTLDHFSEIFSRVDVGKYGSVTLRDNELSLIVRHPELANTLGSKSVSKELSARFKAGNREGTYRALAGIDNTERMISYRTIGDYPLVVIVARATKEYLSDWRRELFTQLGLVALFTLVTIMSSRMLLVRWKREKKVESDLRRVNDELEQHVAQRTIDLNQANAQLSKELALSESLLLNSPAGIRVFDVASGQCILVNQAAADIAGGTREALLSQNFHDLDSWQESGLLSVAAQVIADGVPRSIETSLHSSFNKDVPVSYQFSRFSSLERQHLLVIGRDITEEKRLAEEKQRIEDQMLHAQKLESMGVLAGGIAHDFNNILTAIIGNAELALMHLNPESPVIENLQRIEKAAGRASDLAKQMLAYSGKGRFVIESIDMNRLVEEMLTMLSVSISKKVKITLNLHRPLATVEADATQVRQVIMNLVINASEAIGESEGGITITSGSMMCDRDYLRDVWFDENLSDGRYVFLEITDTGCGMDKQTLAKIFDPFFTTKFTGRGLGMAAVLGIVRGHKGAIKVYSEPGAGTSFKMLLPASTKPEEISTIERSRESWQGSGTVMLVDDEETILTIGSEMLQELGFQVVTATDGRQALEIFRSRADISFVILDLTMPLLDGEQTFLELRRIRPDIKVIMSSGYNEQALSQKFAGKGLAGFIQKPYRLSMLKEEIRALSL